MQDSLGGNTLTTFIITVSPAAPCLEETLSTLNFADRAMSVRILATADSDTHANADPHAQVTMPMILILSILTGDIRLMRCMLLYVIQRDTLLFYFSLFELFSGVRPPAVDCINLYHANQKLCISAL